MNTRLCPALVVCSFFLTLSLLNAQESTQARMREAERRMQAGSWDLALTLYERILRDDPLSDAATDAAFLRAVALFRLERYAEAYGAFRRSELRHPSPRHGRTLSFWTGAAAYYSGDYGAAIAALEAYLASGDDLMRRDALLYIALCLEAVGRPAEASARLAARFGPGAAEKPHEDPYAFSVYLALLLKAEEYERLLEAAPQEAIDTMPPRWRAQAAFYRAEALWKTGRREESERNYLMAAESVLAADVAAAAFDRLILLHARDAAQIERIVREAEQRLAAQTDLLIRLWTSAGARLAALGRSQAARFMLMRVWDLRTSRQVPVQAALHLAGLLNDAGEYEAAVAVCLEALVVTTGAPDRLRYKLGELHVERRNWTDAEAVWRELLRLHPDSPTAPAASYFLALTLVNRNRAEEALSVIDELRARDAAGGHVTEANGLRAQILLRLGRIAEAIDAYRAYLHERPQDGAARSNYLRALFNAGRYEHVLAAHASHYGRRPPGADPRAAGDAYLAGLSALALGRYDESERLFALIEPVHADLFHYSLFYLGWGSYRAGRYDRAEDFFIRAAAGPAELAAKSRYYAGWSAYTRRDYAAAQRHFAAFAAQAQGQAQARGLLMYGRSLAGAGAFLEAVLSFSQTAERFAAQAEGAEAVFEQASALNRLGRHEEAAAVFGRYIARHPGAPLMEQAVYGRAEALHRAGRHQDAVDAFNVYRRLYPAGSLADAALYWGGLAALRSNQPRYAHLLWSKLYEEHRRSPFRADALFGLAEIEREAGNHAEALRLYTEFAAVFPEQVGVRRVRDLIERVRLVLAGRSEREAELALIIRRENRAATAAGRRAIVELAELVLANDANPRRWDEVAPPLKDVAAKAEADPAMAARAGYLYGEYLYRRGELQAAAQEFLRAAVMNPADADFTAQAMFRAVQMALLAGRRGDAEIMTRRLEAGFRDSAWAVDARNLLERTR